MPTRELSCSFCGRGFQRICHLRRHENEHSSVDYPCQFCPKRFTRRDVARRHALACPHRKDQDVRAQKRGRKPRACDRCSKAKLSCNNELPCQRCAARFLNCTYWCVDNEPSGLSSVAERLIDLSEPTSLSFLLQITNPRSHAVAKYVVTDKTAVDGCFAVRSRTTSFSRPKHVGADPYHHIIGLSGRASENYIDGHQRLRNSDSASSNVSSTESIRVLDTLQDRLDLMYAEVQSTSIMSLADYATFFTCTAYSVFIPAVSNYRQWQWSIIHWPTLCLEKISYPLLLALGLGGAGLVEVRGGLNNIYASDNVFHDIVESYVFDCLEVAMALYEQPQLDTQLIETCQAALLVIALESGINDSATKRRLLTKRLPSLVSAIRTLDLAAQSHPKCSDVPLWGDFVRRESCIRIVVWTFLQDALFTLICCYPPSLTATEMICDLPCNGSFWNAESELAFRIQWGSEVSVKESPSLKQAIWCLIGEDSSTRSNEELAKLSVDHLFVLIWGVHSALFNIRSSAPACIWSTTFQGALNRWSMFWKVAVREIQRYEEPEMDYIISASETAVLLSRIVDIELNGQKGTLSYFRGIVHYATEPIYELVKHVSM